MRRYLLSLAAGLLATAAVPGVAAAATDAVTTTDLNMRAGPSTSYPVVEVLPDNAEVTVYGCLGGYSWCDVSWRDARGWVSANYLSSYTNSRYVPIVEYGPEIGLPVVDFVFDTYWDNYYRGRSWYGNRARWRSYWRDHRRDVRADRRRDRREDRAERREDRRDARAERRENRVEQRQDRRRERAERRVDRRDARSDRRQNRVQQLRRSRDARAQQRRERRVERRERARGSQVQRRDFGAQRQAPRRQMESRGPGRSVQRGGGGGRDAQRGGGGGRDAQRGAGGGDRRRGG